MKKFDHSILLSGCYYKDMKILLTGMPKSGKSTMLANLIAGVRPKHGLTSPEIRENSERVGFDLCDETGNTAPLSRVKPLPITPSGVTMLILDRLKIL